MVSNDRPPSRPLSPSIAASSTASAALSPAVPTGAAGGAHGHASAGDAVGVQTATFTVGRYSLVLSAAPGRAELRLTAGEIASAVAIDAQTLAGWSRTAARLLALEPADDPRGRVEFRAPFLTDVACKPTIALACEVSEQSVEFRLHVSNVSGDDEVLPVDKRLAEALLQAASGAAVVAGGSVPGPAPAS